MLINICQYIFTLIAIIILITIYLIYRYFFQKPLLTNNTSQEQFENKEKEIDLPGNPFFIISIDGKEVGKLNFELFDDDVPNTSSNFRYLCVKV